MNYLVLGCTGSPPNGFWIDVSAQVKGTKGLKTRHATLRTYVTLRGDVPFELPDVLALYFGQPSFENDERILWPVLCG